MACFPSLTSGKRPCCRKQRELDSIEFDERVSRIEHACRITGVNRPEHLIASHCKLWRDCESNDESLRRMGIPSVERRNVGGFTEGQRRYLELHRQAVFLEVRVRT